MRCSTCLLDRGLRDEGDPMMDPTPWKRPAWRGVTLASAPPTTALERPVASSRWLARPSSVGITAARHQQAQARAAEMVELAQLRLWNLAPVAVHQHENLCTSATSEAVRLGAANSLVDRSVGRATERIQVAAAITVKRPW